MAFNDFQLPGTMERISLAPSSILIASHASLRWQAIHFIPYIQRTFDCPVITRVESDVFVKKMNKK